MEEFRKQKVEEYIELINLIKKSTDNYRLAEAQSYLETYKLLCETIAMLYMKEHGYCEMPNFGYVPEFEYDNYVGEYIPLDEYTEINGEE